MLNRMDNVAIRRNTAPDAKNLGEGSSQPCQTTGGPGALPRLVRTRNSAVAPSL